MASSEISRLIAIKNALYATTSTQGWIFIKQIADNLVDKAITEALEEEDRDKGEGKRLKAAALKKGFNELFNAIESAKAIDPEVDLDSGLGNLEREHDATAN